MRSVYLLTLRQMFGRWRLLIMTVLASLPALLAVLMVRSTNAPDIGEFEQVVLDGMLAGSITPLVVLAIATAASPTRSKTARSRTSRSRRSRVGGSPCRSC